MTYQRIAKGPGCFGQFDGRCHVCQTCGDYTRCKALKAPRARLAHVFRVTKYAYTIEGATLDREEEITDYDTVEEVETVTLRSLKALARYIESEGLVSYSPGATGDYFQTSDDEIDYYTGDCTTYQFCLSGHLTISQYRRLRALLGNTSFD